MEFIHISFNGMLFAMAVIGGIGPQTVNLMSHAIVKRNEFLVASVCFVGDALLILIGTYGLKFLNSKPFLTFINIVGVSFLLYYLILKIKGLTKIKNLTLNTIVVSKHQALIRALALTWLNPLVYIDALIVIGGASTHYLGLEQVAFTCGAIVGDFTWVFGITTLTRLFSAKLNNLISWIVLDSFTILILCFILIKLCGFLVNG